MRVSYEFNPAIEAEFGPFKVRFEGLKINGLRKNKKELNQKSTFALLLNDEAEYKAFEIRRARELQSRLDELYK